MNRARLVWLFAAALLAISESTRADDPPRGDGFFGGLRNVLSPSNGNETWERARALARAAEAAPIMEQLARNERDPETGGKAALWLGLYRYGSGDATAALPYFERAASLNGDAETRRAGAAWAAQCRALLDPKTLPEPNGEALGPRSSPFELREILAHADASVREGRAQEALDAYLEVQGEAMSAGMLSLLYYRLGLVVQASVAAGARLVDPELLHEWEPHVAESAERALVVKLEEEGRLFEKPAEPAVSEFVAPSEELVVTDEATLDTLAASTPESEPQEEAPHYVLQLGSFRDRDLARAEMERLVSRGLSVRLVPGTDREGNQVYRVWLGRGSTREEARALGDRLLQGLEYQIVESPQ